MPKFQTLICEIADKKTAYNKDCFYFQIEILRSKICANVFESKDITI